MCLILDNNQWGDFLEQKTDMQPIHEWLNKQNGKLIYSDHKGFTELSNRYLRRLQDYKRAGKARLVSKEKVEREIKNIKKSHDLTSDDVHILGLAKAENIKVLCSNDQDLHEDFKKVVRNGHVYQKKAHKHLLVKDLCP